MDVKPFEDKTEKLFRAVRSPHERPNLWRADGRVSNAAFELRKNESGVSVNRALGRSDEEAIDATLEKLSGLVVSLTIKDIIEVSVNVIHSPSKDNIFHSEIRYSDNDSEIEIKRKQIALANLAKLEEYSKR